MYKRIKLPILYWWPDSTRIWSKYVFASSKYFAPNEWNSGGGGYPFGVIENRISTGRKRYCYITVHNTIYGLAAALVVHVRIINIYSCGGIKHPGRSRRRRRGRVHRSNYDFERFTTMRRRRRCYSELCITRENIIPSIIRVHLFIFFFAFDHSCLFLFIILRRLRTIYALFLVTCSRFIHLSYSFSSLFIINV